MCLSGPHRDKALDLGQEPEDLGMGEIIILILGFPSFSWEEI